MSKKDKIWVIFGVFGAAGFQLTFCVIGGLYLGDYCDKYFGWDPWGKFAGVIIGFIAGIYNLYRLLNWREKL